jgi:hypothetical protein
LPKAVHKHDQSIESGQHTSTRAFFESLTKPTHEDTVLLPFGTRHSSSPFTRLSRTAHRGRFRNTTAHK